MIETWIGCSGFHYKEWKDVFYPTGLPQRKWFEYYCKHFNTLELNTTFYRFQDCMVCRTGTTTVRISIAFRKGAQVITHYKQLKDSKRMLSDFYGTTREGLGNNLAAFFFNFPIVLKSEEMVERIIDNIDPHVYQCD